MKTHRSDHINSTVNSFNAFRPEKIHQVFITLDIFKFLNNVKIALSCIFKSRSLTFDKDDENRRIQERFTSNSGILLSCLIRSTRVGDPQHFRSSNQCDRRERQNLKLFSEFIQVFVLFAGASFGTLGVGFRSRFRFRVSQYERFVILIRVRSLRSVGISIPANEDSPLPSDDSDGQKS